jgi:sugar phosphate permease
MALDHKELNSGADPVPKNRIYYGWYLVIASWLMTFLVYAVSPGLFFKPLLDEFHWDRAALSLVSSIVMLIFAGLFPFIGRLIDHFGPRIMLTATAVIQVLSSVVCGLAQGIWAIFISRFLYEFKPAHGTQVLVNRWFIRKRGRALGILSTAIPLGQLALSPVSQYLIIIWGWRETIFFWSVLMALFALPVIILVRDDPQKKGLLPDGYTEEISKPGPGERQVQSESGLTIKATLRSHSLWLLYPAHLICGLTCGLLLIHTIIFATDLGYSALIGASFLSVQGGVSLLGVVVTGVLSDRLPRSKVLSLTHFIRSLGLLLVVIAILTGGQALWLLFAAMAVFGFGFFATSPLVGGLVADLFGNLRMGTIIGLIFSSHAIGMAVGIYAGGITYQLTGSYLDIFLALTFLEFLACFLVFLIKKPAKFS